LNSELARKPFTCLEFIIVHELLHLIEPNHGERFVSLMDANLPDWRQRRDLLNSSPLANETWTY
jgi:predicted metal-dependent hydrolase